MKVIDMFKPKWKSSNWQIRVSAVKNISDEDKLFKIVLSDTDDRVKKAAIENITDKYKLYDITLSTCSNQVCLAAINRISSSDTLSNIALETKKEGILFEALERMDSHHVWQRYASPIWMDIQQTDVLKYTTARDKDDEKHICPLQLPVIKRLLTLYSKEGETLLSPFGGIGSEGYQALKMGRKSISIELKESYFEINKKNHADIEFDCSQPTLF